MKGREERKCQLSVGTPRPPARPDGVWAKGSSAEPFCLLGKCPTEGVYPLSGEEGNKPHESKMGTSMTQSHPLLVCGGGRAHGALSLKPGALQASFRREAGLSYPLGPQTPCLVSLEKPKSYF